MKRARHITWGKELLSAVVWKQPVQETKEVTGNKDLGKGGINRDTHRKLLNGGTRNGDKTLN